MSKPIYIKKNGIMNKISSMSIGVNTPFIYSEDEREVGVWTDGKPLYQKTVKPTVTDITNRSYIDSDFTNSDMIMIIDGYYVVAGAVSSLKLALNQYENSYYLTRTGFREDKSMYLVVEGYTVQEGSVITVQYTKTTDTPGSGKWSNNGGPAHHYSTSEQVVGTWIDGKTLYEKTFYIENLPYSAATLAIADLSEMNVDKVILFQGFCTSKVSDGYQRPIPLPDGSNDIRADVTEHILQIKVLADWGSYEGYLTLQYTKATN